MLARGNTSFRNEARDGFLASRRGKTIESVDLPHPREPLFSPRPLEGDCAASSGAHLYAVGRDPAAHLFRLPSSGVHRWLPGRRSGLPTWTPIRRHPIAAPPAAWHRGLTVSCLLSGSPCGIARWPAAWLVRLVARQGVTHGVRNKPSGFFEGLSNRFVAFFISLLPPGLSDSSSFILRILMTRFPVV